MYDRLTKGDIEKMQKEIDERKLVLRKQLIGEVQEARAQGELSENFEYYAAKRAKNQNESRIRYLEKMIETAHIVSDRSAEDEVGLFDKVTVWFDEDEEEDVFQIVTTVKGDALRNLITAASPLGKALMGHKVGETVRVAVNERYSYPVTIRKIEKQRDDGSIKISSY